MTHKVGISSQVLISVVRVRLNALAREVLAEEHHLAHLILGQALGVDVVWIGVRQGLDRRYNLNRAQARPSSHLTRVLRLFVESVIGRPAFPIAKDLNELVKFALNEEFVDVLLS